MTSKSSDYIFRNIEDLPSAKTVLILGAGVYENGELSPFLKDRTDTAAKIFFEGKAKNILVSGDNSDIEYNEVEPVRKYLLSKGVPDSVIYLDYAGFDTYDSIVRAEEIFKQHVFIVVSQEFHLARAIFIGREKGLEVFGYPATKHSVHPKNNIREVFARIKAFLDVAWDVDPKFHGKEINIE